MGRRGGGAQEESEALPEERRWRSRRKKTRWWRVTRATEDSDGIVKRDTLRNYGMEK
jgi:hypothetical protein